MANIFLCAFLLTIILYGQETDTSITISHFNYPEIEGITIILDEGGENSISLDTHYPRILNDYSIHHVMVDGALHLPRGSYFLPALLPKGTAPDSIHNYSQIHYRKGDYNSGELGLALQIERTDSSYFSLQGFRQTPPVMYSSSSWNDNLQNYLMSYEFLLPDASLALDVMYHLEDYHLPLFSGNEPEYERKVESFHGGFSFKKRWENLCLDFYPAFQLTNADRQDSLATYFTLWNNFSSKLYLGDHFNLALQQRSKMMMAEKDSHLTEIKTHILRPILQYNSKRIMLEGGVALYNGIIEPEGKALWRNKHLYVGVGREFHIYFAPVHMAEHVQIEYSISSIDIGYISNTLNIILDIFQVSHSSGDQPGMLEEIEIDLSWMRLSQKAGIYNINRDDDEPIDMFNQISLLFSPNIWIWRTARFQPFIGLESFYLKHSGLTDINPAKVPIIDMDIDLGSYTSQLLNIELGFLVNRFKVSSRWVNILNKSVQNSSSTYPIHPIQQLVVVWQFWN